MYLAPRGTWYDVPGTCGSDDPTRAAEEYIRALYTLPGTSYLYAKTYHVPGTCGSDDPTRAAEEHPRALYTLPGTSYLYAKSMNESLMPLTQDALSTHLVNLEHEYPARWVGEHDLNPSSRVFVF